MTPWSLVQKINNPCLFFHGNYFFYYMLNYVLVISDRPDPPIQVEFLNCGQRIADITWIPGSDNNDPIIDYIPYYHTSFNEEGIYVAVDPVEHRTDVQNVASFTNSPWTNYTFHVRARNKFGVSDPSNDTTLCETSEDIPYKVPTGVCTDLVNPSKLIVTWQVSETTGIIFFQISLKF